MSIHKGCVARCSLGRLGLVTSEKPEHVTYPDGNTGVAWTGVQLTDDAGGIGGSWSSRNPKLELRAYDVEFAIRCVQSLAEE